MKFCCEKFAEQAGAIKALAGGGFMYPPDMRPSGQIEWSEHSNHWNVNGCCGGGCYVLDEIEFCPFCGTKLEEPNDNA